MTRNVWNKLVAPQHIKFVLNSVKDHRVKNVLSIQHVNPTFRLIDNFYFVIKVRSEKNCVETSGVAKVEIIDFETAKTGNVVGQDKGVLVKLIRSQQFHLVVHNVGWKMLNDSLQQQLAVPRKHIFVGKEH